LPNLYALLDEREVLVYRAAMGRLDREPESISGAFYNHPELGYCILVNTDTAPGRQSFTLAHEWAHALFHYAKGGIICRSKDTDPLERFADAFAASFLVPGKELRRLASEFMNPLEALKLAQYFSVSYAMIALEPGTLD
jgi:Zn-dependent peptidase ImmA (M78 family)